MSSYSEYNRERFQDQKIRLQEFESNLKKITRKFTGRKRKYEVTMVYQNDYLLVYKSHN